MFEYKYRKINNFLETRPVEGSLVRIAFERNDR